MGRIQPISLCKPCVMSMRSPNSVGKAVQTNSTLFRYASAITEQKKCWELLAEKFDRFQTLRNNTQQHPTTCNRVCKRTQHVTSNNAGSCWSTVLRPFARSPRLSLRYFMVNLFFRLDGLLRLSSRPAGESYGSLLSYLLGKIRY